MRVRLLTKSHVDHNLSLQDVETVLMRALKV